MLRATHLVSGLAACLALAGALLLPSMCGGEATQQTRPRGWEAGLEGTPLSGCGSNDSEAWQSSVAAALREDDLRLPGRTAFAATAERKVRALAGRLRSDEFSAVSAASFSRELCHARAILCSDTHHRVLPALVMGRVLRLLRAGLGPRVSKVLVLVEWIPSSANAEFRKLIRGPGRSMPATDEEIASFLKSRWAWPVNDRARVLAYAVREGMTVRGVGLHSPAVLPSSEVRDQDRRPLEQMDREEYETLMRSKNEAVVRATRAWLQEGGPGRSVVVLTGAHHVFTDEGGVLEELRRLGLSPATILNGVNAIDHAVAESSLGFPARCWIDFGGGCYYGPVLTRGDWLEYLRRR